MTPHEEILKLQKKRDMALYQRKITTQICTVWEYDRVISEIDARIAELEKVEN
jgi:hypothetical protein